MTYTPTIPNSTDLISTSQGQIKDNFGQLNTQFGIDHVAFNTGSGNGDGHHKQITFDNAPSAPSVSGTMSAIYPALVGSIQSLIFKNATQTIQLTGPYSFGTNNNTAGYVTLQGGLILQWGPATLSNESTYNFSTGGIAFPTYCFNVQITPNSNTNSSVCGVNGMSNTGFTFRLANSGSIPITFFAIGI